MADNKIKQTTWADFENVLSNSSQNDMIYVTDKNIFCQLVSAATNNERAIGTIGQLSIGQYFIARSKYNGQVMSQRNRAPGLYFEIADKDPNVADDKVRLTLYYHDGFNKWEPIVNTTEAQPIDTSNLFISLQQIQEDTDLDNLIIPGNYGIDKSCFNKPINTSGSLLILRYNNTQWPQQLFLTNANEENGGHGDLYYRGARTIDAKPNDSGSGWYDWVKLINVHTLTTELNNYLPLSGGTMSGPITLAEGYNEGLIFPNGIGQFIAPDQSALFWYDHTNGNLRVGSHNKNLYLRGKQTRPQYTTDGATFKDLALADDLGNYLPLSGGTLTGKLTGTELEMHTAFVDNQLQVGSGDGAKVLINTSVPLKTDTVVDINGHIKVNYVYSTWLYTSAAERSNAKSERIAVLKDGWIYYRTPTDILGDIGALPLAGGKMTGNITWAAGSIAQENDLNFFLGIRAFDQGGGTYFAPKNEVIKSLGVVTLTGTQTITGAKTFTSNVNITGTLLNLNAASGNAGIELGSTNRTTTPYIDFHTSAVAADYQSRILASGNGLTIYASDGLTLSNTPLYLSNINPAGSNITYIGGYNNSPGWFRVVNSGRNDGGQVQQNIGTISSPQWVGVGSIKAIRVDESTVTTEGNIPLSAITNITVRDVTNSGSAGTSTSGLYLPLTGGTVTGNLNVTKGLTIAGKEVATKEYVDKIGGGAGNGSAGNLDNGMPIIELTQTPTSDGGSLNIGIKVLSGSLQVGDEFQICKRHYTHGGMGRPRMRFKPIIKYIVTQQDVDRGSCSVFINPHTTDWNRLNNSDHDFTGFPYNFKFVRVSRFLPTANKDPRSRAIHSNTITIRPVFHPPTKQLRIY